MMMMKDVTVEKRAVAVIRMHVVRVVIIGIVEPELFKSLGSVMSLRDKFCCFGRRGMSMGK
jgi:hypothetical protein